MTSKYIANDEENTTCNTNQSEQMAPWMKQLFRTSSRRGSLCSVASDPGTDLLEDFPKRPRRRSYSSGIPTSVNTSNYGSIHHAYDNADIDTDSNDSNQDELLKYQLLLIEAKLKKDDESNKSKSNNKKRRQVRFSSDRPTIHFYYKPLTKKCMKTLWLSKSDKHVSMRSALMSAKQIHDSLKVHGRTLKFHQEMESSSTFSAATAAAACKHSTNSNSMAKAIDFKTTEQKVQDFLHAMLPSPSKFPSHICRHEIVGLDHLIGNKKVVLALNNLRKNHSQAVLGHFSVYGNQDSLANISYVYSSFSAHIAWSRAKYVAEMDDNIIV